jgi:hypothetical protein
MTPPPPPDPSVIEINLLLLTWFEQLGADRYLILGKHTVLVLYAVLIIISFHSSDKIEGLLFYRRIHKLNLALKPFEEWICFHAHLRVRGSFAQRFWSTLTNACYRQAGSRYNNAYAIHSSVITGTDDSWKRTGRLQANRLDSSAYDFR